METRRLSQDVCRCSHVALVHRDGEGECGTCAVDIRSAWAQLSRCRRFDWNATWETRDTA